VSGHSGPGRVRGAAVLEGNASSYATCPISNTLARGWLTRLRRRGAMGTFEEVIDEAFDIPRSAPLSELGA